jgi:succinate dehydrogenase / fumarate reductase cytochrome b subunit
VWLWSARGGLLAAAAVHVAGVASLARASRAARSRRARGPGWELAGLGARTMRVGGVLLFAFVAYHLLHLTVGVVHPRFQPGRVYDNVVAGLQPLPVAAVYVGAALLLGLHLFHGLWAAMRSLGLRPGVAGEHRRPVVVLVSGAVALGFASVPLAVLAGWLR